MARITDRLVIQRSDHTIVVMDESSGAEITFPVEVTGNVRNALAYLESPERFLARPDLLAEAVDLLVDAETSLTDPGLRASWTRRRDQWRENVIALQGRDT